MRPKQAFTHQIDAPRLGEFDLGGVLYHANYFSLFEATREAFLRAHGMPYTQLIAERAHLAVVESYQNFDKPIRYGEPIRIYLWSSDCRRTTAVFNYEVTVLSPAKEETTVHTAWTRLAYVRESDGELKPARLPEKLLAVIRAVEQIPKDD